MIRQALKDGAALAALVLFVLALTVWADQLPHMIGH